MLFRSRGYHLSREYSVDPLEILFVREVMRTNVVALPADVSINELSETLHDGRSPRQQSLYPVVDGDKKLVGVVTGHELRQLVQEQNGRRLADVVKTDPVVAHPDEPLRVVAYRMAETGLTRFPVLERDGSRKLVGIVSLADLLKARTHTLDAEHRRERVLPVKLRFPGSHVKRAAS